MNTKNIIINNLGFMSKLFCVVIVMISCVLFFENVFAQESVIPLRYNSLLFGKGHQSNIRSSVSLPFVDDFSYNSYTPDSLLWQNSGAFVNTTFPVDPVSIGVVSFDGLNGNGIPYDSLSFSFTSIDSADMLTSMPILLDSLGPADSVYLSFFYQAGVR